MRAGGGGRARALPDLALMSLAGRIVYMAFDGDAATNEPVAAARREFAKLLRAAGADVRVVDLPLDGNVKGPDDFIGRFGTLVS